MRARAVVAKADAKSKTLITLVDVKSGFWPVPPPDRASAKQMLAFATKAAQFGGSHPVAIAKAQRREFCKQLAEALEPVGQIGAVATFLKTAAGYVEGHASALPDAPDEVPFEIVASIKAARRYVQAGMVEAEAVALPLRRAADDAFEVAERARMKRRKFASTLSIALNNQTDRYLRRCGMEAVANIYKEKVAKQTYLHRVRFGGKRRAK